MDTPAPHIALGSRGESLACDTLERAGYEILATHYRTRVGEIDIVARDRDCLVFVEVKARRGIECGTPAEAVTPRKQRKVAAMARDYLAIYEAMLVGLTYDMRSAAQAAGADLFPPISAA